MKNMNKLKGKVIVKVGIYLRKSRAEDGVQDLKKHKDYLVSICNRNEWLYELYEEIDSSQDIFRSELQRLRQDIALGKIDAVMVNAVDRLSRRARHFLEIVEDYFIKEGMTTLFVKDTEHNLLDSSTITMLQLQATLSQAEYSFIVARLAEGKREAFKNGIWSGKMVYGYKFDKEKQKIVPDEEEFKVSRKICDMMLEGYTYGGAAKEINKLGYRTRMGNEFDVHNIKSIVHSPCTRGHIIVNWMDEEISKYNNHKAVMTDSEYNQILKIIERRNAQYPNLAVAPKHFLQGLLKCFNCGLNISVSANKKSKYINGVRTYGEYEYYVRTCRQKRCNVKNYGCRDTDVEAFIREILKNYSIKAKEKMEFLKDINQEEIKKGQFKKTEELKRAIKKHENKEESLLDLLLEGTITKEVYNKRIELIKNEKATLIAELNSLPTVDVEQESKFASNTFDLIKAYDDLDNEGKRRLLQLIFSKIVYKRTSKTEPPELEVHFN